MNSVVSAMLGVPCITDCIIGELEKLGSQFSVALKYVVLLYTCAHTHACTHTHTYTRVHTHTRNTHIYTHADVHTKRLLYYNVTPYNQ